MPDLRLPAAPGAAAMARRHVRELPIEEPTIEVVSLLVTELVTNALRHSPEPAASDIDVRLESTADRVRVDVRNAGHGFEWDREATGRFTDPGGLGLVLVDKLADRWGVDGGGCTHVWLEVDRAPSGEREEGAGSAASSQRTRQTSETLGASFSPARSRTATRPRLSTLPRSPFRIT